MKDEGYVWEMLKRAESIKRKALREGNEIKFQAYSVVIRQLKIVLDVKKNTGKNRLKKAMDFNAELIK